MRIIMEFCLVVRLWKFQVSPRHSLQVSLSLKNNEWEDFQTYGKARPPAL